MDKRTLLAILFAGMTILINACGSTTTLPIEHSSASSTAAASIAGALSGKEFSNIIAKAPKEMPGSERLKVLATAATTANANICPSLLSDTLCLQAPDLTGVADLSLEACQFQDSQAIFTGVLQISGSDAVVCGQFANTSKSRQFVLSTESNMPFTGTRKAASGTEVVIDHASPNLGNFLGDDIPPTIGSGYGVTVTWTEGVPTAITVDQRIHSSQFDRSILGTLTLSPALIDSNLLEANGTLTIYENLKKVKAVATFIRVVFDLACVHPIAGTIQTAFNGGTPVGGQITSEALTFGPDCGMATYTPSNDDPTSVALVHVL